MPIPPPVRSGSGSKGPCAAHVSGPRPPPRCAATLRSANQVIKSRLALPMRRHGDLPDGETEEWAAVYAVLRNARRVLPAVELKAIPSGLLLL